MVMYELSIIEYKKLNPKQKENYNFQKVSAVLADYGFSTIRLSDDWQGADFIANHVDGKTFLKVQLKGVLTVNAVYEGKDIYICFRRHNIWYLYPHDRFLEWALDTSNTNIRNTQGWEIASDGRATTGSYTWPGPKRSIMEWLENYKLT